MRRPIAIALLLPFVLVPLAGASAWTYRPLTHTTARAIAPSGDGAVVAIDGFTKGVLRIDARGEVVAAKQVSRAPFTLDTTPAGEVLLALDTTRVDFAIAKLRADLTPVWAKRIGIAAPWQPADVPSVAATSDGGACVARSLEDLSFVIRLASDGAVAWSAFVNASGQERFHSVAATSDGGCVAAGERDGDPWLVKAGAKGEVEWQRSFGSDGHFVTVVETSDGEIVAAGTSRRNVIVARTNGSGEPRWQRRGSRVLEGTARVSAAAGAAGSAIVSVAENDTTVCTLDRDGSATACRRLAAKVEAAAVAEGARLIAASATGWWQIHPGADRFRVLHAGSGDATGCAGSETSSDLADDAAATNILPLEVGTLRLLVSADDLGARDLALEATPFACTSFAAAAPAVAARSPFRGAADADAFGREIGRLLREGSFAELDRIAEDARRTRSFFDPMFWKIELFYNAIRDVPELNPGQRLEHVRKWRQARPDSVTACIADALLLQKNAWEYRGSGTGDTLTGVGANAYAALTREAQRVLASCGGAADADPHAWHLRAQFAGEGDGDVRDVARRGAALHRYPTLFRTAALYLHASWGGSPTEYLAFADEAARLTNDTYGDALYMWLVYQARFNVERAEYDREYKARADWPRVRRGFDDAIRLAPAWLPTYHRYALMARWFDDRATARTLFQRPELAWYEGAASMWRSRSEYDAARTWALMTEPEPKPAANASRQWPDIVLQGELVHATGTERIAAFLVGTPSGAVGIATFPSKEAKSQLRSWKLWPPRDARQVLSGAALAPAAAQLGLAAPLLLEPFRGDPPVHVLRIAPAGEIAFYEAAALQFYVAGCVWDGEVCAQTVVPAKITSTGGSAAFTYYNALLDRPYRAGSFHGGVLLDANGQALGVITGTYEQPDGRASIAAIDLRGLAQK